MKVQLKLPLDSSDKKIKKQVMPELVQKNNNLGKKYEVI